MAYSFYGWAPPDRIRRSVLLPLQLDEQIATYAVERQSTPSTVLSETLQHAVDENCLEAENVVHSRPRSNEYVERAVVLDPAVTERLEDSVYKLRFGRNGDSADIDFSDLVIALVDHYFQMNGNGNGSSPDA